MDFNGFQWISMDFNGAMVGYESEKQLDMKGKKTDEAVHTANHYHLCSEGTKTDVLFHDRQEFISGMNIVALAVHHTGVRMLAFCLMDNHFHFVLSATEEQVWVFARKVSQIYQMRRFHSGIGHSEPIKWNAHLIPDLQYLQNAIAYVLRNPVSASYHFVLTDYPWSSASLYFRDHLQIQLFGLQRLSDLAATERRSILKTRTELPSDWYVTPSGFIWPGSYVDIKTVERNFQYARWFQILLHSNKSESISSLLNSHSRICLSDIELREHAKQISRELFFHSNLSNLKLQQRENVREELIRTLGASDKQIAKILRLEYK